MRYSLTTARKVVQHQGLHYNRMEKSNFKLFLEDCATYHTEDIVYQAMVKVILFLNTPEKLCSTVRKDGELSTGEQLGNFFFTSGN